MIVADTNVVSELMRDEPRQEVVAWLDDRPARDLFVTAVTEAEIFAGIAFLSAGRRRRALEAAAERAFRVLFAGRILPFDSTAAREYAEVAALRRSAGRPVAPVDCQVAAIARSRGMMVATRNVRDFERTGVEVVDPWTAA